MSLSFDELHDENRELLIFGIMIHSDSECMIINDSNYCHNTPHYLKSCNVKIGECTFNLRFDDHFYNEDDPINELASKLAKRPIQGSAHIVCLKHKKDGYENMKTDHKQLKKVAKKFKCYEKMTWGSIRDDIFN